MHFADRDALLAAVMERVGRGVLDALIGATGGGDDLASVVARFLRGLSTGAYPLTRAGGVRPYQLLDACARSPEVRKQYVTLVREAVARLARRSVPARSRAPSASDLRPADVGMLLVDLAIGVHTLVDLEVPLDLGRAASPWSRWASRRSPLEVEARAIAPERVVRRVLEHLAERRVVEDHLDEACRPSRRAASTAWPDVHELRRALADAVAAEELARRAVEDELHDAVLVADDLAARVVAVERAAHDEVEALLLRVLLGEADAAHLRDRVDAERQQVARPAACR